MAKGSKPIFVLNEEEKELSVSFDRKEWESVENLEEEKTRARKAAHRYRNKDALKRIAVSDLMKFSP